MVSSGDRRTPQFRHARSPPPELAGLELALLSRDFVAYTKRGPPRQFALVHPAFASSPNRPQVSSSENYFLRMLEVGVPTLQTSMVVRGQRWRQAALN